MDRSKERTLDWIEDWMSTLDWTSFRMVERWLRCKCWIWVENVETICTTTLSKWEQLSMPENRTMQWIDCISLISKLFPTFNIDRNIIQWLKRRNEKHLEEPFIYNDHKFLGKEFWLQVACNKFFGKSKQLIFWILQFWRWLPTMGFELFLLNI